MQGNSNARRFRELSEELRKKDEEMTVLKRALVDRELATALTSNGIAPWYVRGASALLRESVSLDVHVDECVIKICGEEPTTFLKSWAAGEEGRRFRASDEQSVVDKTPNPFTAQHWNRTNQGRLIRSDRTKAERFARAAGFKSLDEACRAVAAKATV